jgi:hypothetical protein
MLTMTDTSQYTNRIFDLTMEACTRLRHLSLDVAGDKSFIDGGGRIVYAVDNDVLNFFADPFLNAGYADVFELSQERRKKSEYFHGVVTEDNIIDTALAVLDGIFGPDNAGPFPIDLLLLPPYVEELTNTVIYFRNAASTRPVGARDSRTVEDSITAVEQVMADYKSGELDLVPAYRKLIDACDPIVRYALWPEATPLNRLLSLAKRGIKTSQQALLGAGRLQDIAKLREDDIWAVAFELLVSEASHGRSTDAAARDADAIAILVNLNETFAGEVVYNRTSQKRALLLTGDPTLTRVLTDRDGRLGRQLYRRLNFCLARHPLQVGRFKLLNGADDADNAKQRGSIRHFDGFLRRKDWSEKQYYHELMRARFEQRSVLKTVTTRADDLERHLTQNSVENLREVIQDLGRQNATNAAIMHGSLEDFSERLKQAKNDVPALLQQGLLSIEDSTARLSQTLGIAVLVTETQRDGLVWILERTLANAGTTKLGRNGARRLVRLPSALRFSESQLEYFKELLDMRPGPHVDDGKSSAYLQVIGRIGLREFYLANAYLSAVCNDWRRAARWCEEALAAGEATPSIIVESECRYFRALAIRHWVKPDAKQWAAAAKSLEALVKGDAEVDVRYLSEYAALGLSVPYHDYIYGKSTYGNTVPHPNPSQTRVMLVACETKFQQWVEPRNQLWCRVGVQIYTNLLLIFIMQRLIPPRLAFGCSDDWQIDRYRSELLAIAETDGGTASLSYFVRFVIAAIDYIIAGETTSARDQLAHDLEDIIEQHPDGILLYDMKKIDDLRAYAGLRKI